MDIWRGSGGTCEEAAKDMWAIHFSLRTFFPPPYFSLQFFIPPFFLHLFFLSNLFFFIFFPPTFFYSLFFPSNLVFPCTCFLHFLSSTFHVFHLFYSTFCISQKKLVSAVIFNAIETLLNRARRSLSLQSICFCVFVFPARAGISMLRFVVRATGEFCRHVCQ